MNRIPNELIVKWLDRILTHEGLYTDDPDDRGNWTGGEIDKGELRGTKYGISAAAYPDEDIVNLTVSRAAELYREDYLLPLKAWRFRDAVAFQMLDIAVNSGPQRARLLVQKAVGVPADGAIGPVTLAAMKSMSESDLAFLLIAERICFYTQIGTWHLYGKGWMVRMAENLRWAALDTDD